MANRLPRLLQRKIYKTGQTRGADDDVIYQNRVNRNSTVLIPLAFYDACRTNPVVNGEYENGFIVLVKPEDYFDNVDAQTFMQNNGLALGTNSLLFYETRKQWNDYNPDNRDLSPATSRENPLGGHYVARVPSTTRSVDEKISFGFNTSGLKGAGIRVFEYASSETIKQCQEQLEYVFWRCFDAEEVTIVSGMTAEEATERKAAITELCQRKELAEIEQLQEARIIDSDGHAICPLCLKKLSANGFLNRLEQAEGRDVPDLTVTQINLFHIRELRTGEFNHRPYNLGWGHHHCNVVCKDSGIDDTLNWMREIIARNQ
ncbi:MAG: hypothetical protein RJB36_1617 [Bacteroidota bacterium]|jgi:hypothetical protein